MCVWGGVLTHVHVEVIFSINHETLARSQNINGKKIPVQQSKPNGQQASVQVKPVPTPFYRQMNIYRNAIFYSGC